MTVAEIRERFLSFFEARDHRRMPSSSLVPPPDDRSVLLTTAGMQQFKPYFRGEQEPPPPRLTLVQKCFRTPDIENVGLTARHLTFFEMLGNFSFGDYFKEGRSPGPGSCRPRASASTRRIWITVFGGDDELGRPTTRRSRSGKRSACPRSGSCTSAARTTSGRPGRSAPAARARSSTTTGASTSAARTTCPGDDTDRFLEFWNLVFMQYDLADDGTMTPLPAPSIDTGLGPDRLAAILQDVPSVYETEHFMPLVRYGEERSGQEDGGEPRAHARAAHLADHGRGMAFLIADGVVPSNEERGYVLRRIMRRAIQQGRALGISDFLPGLCEVVIDTMGDAYPELREQRDNDPALGARGGGELRPHARAGRADAAPDHRPGQGRGTSWVSAEDAFRLHDTYGFPYELTKELLKDEGLRSTTRASTS